jgi:hypothetical protein
MGQRPAPGDDTIEYRLSLGLVTESSPIFYPLPTIPSKQSMIGDR